MRYAEIGLDGAASISEPDLRQIAARMIWESVQRPPANPADFATSSLHVFSVAQQGRLADMAEQLAASSRGAQLRTQKRAPPCRYLDGLASNRQV